MKPYRLLAAAAGLRLGDIAQLEHAALEVPGHIIVHTDKRDRRICLPINGTITPGLAEILAEIPPTDSPYLFPAQAAQYDDISTGRPKFSVYFTRLMDRLGIDRSGAGRKITATWSRVPVISAGRLPFWATAC